MNKFNSIAKSKPVLKWAGGKASLISQISQHFPKQFNRYLEPFLGGGAVFFSLEDNVPSLINDKNPELYNLYGTIRDFPNELMQVLNQFREKYSEDFYYELRKTKFENTIEQAARIIFLNKTCFNGLYRQNLKGEFNVPFGKRIHCPRLYHEGNFLCASHKLKSAKLFNVDFEEIFSLAQEGDFIYCDPPYEPISRTSSFNKYQGQGFSQNEQIRLLHCAKLARANGVTVAISNSSAPFILELYKDFKIHFINARRSINSNGVKRGEIEEVLVLI